MRRIAGIGLLALIGATQAATVTARWSDIGVSGSQVVRDLWQQRDLGTFADRFSATGAGARRDAVEGGVTAVAMTSSAFKAPVTFLSLLLNEQVTLRSPIINR